MPALAVFCAFFLLPMAKLLPISLSTSQGFGIYASVLANPRYLGSLRDTALLSAAVTLAALILGGLSGIFLERSRFWGREAMIAALTLPLSFPGVVVGFMVILWGGRLGLLGSLGQAIFGHKPIFAYSTVGLFVGYLYFSIPRVVLTVMASAGKIPKAREEAARTLGAGPFRALLDITLPALWPSFLSTGAICFATSMGAFGTAFTLAADLNVLPIVIYTEYTLLANLGTASALSLILGLITWAILWTVRLLTGVAPEGSAA
ncbi:MAG: ABC transporter permease subunit [Deltaproteobacteria bacterium]|jgi:putative spermidine/putrescine transport system permease protein|nr:ABC transporter permease subunit [Deltaproteobacteria bacterium]